MRGKERRKRKEEGGEETEGKINHILRLEKYGREEEEEKE